MIRKLLTQPIFRTSLLIVAALALFAAGCQTTETSKLPPSGEKKPLPFQNLQTQKAELLDDSPLAVDSQSSSEPISPERSMTLPSRSQSGSSPGSSSEYPDNLIKGVTAPDSILVVELIFDAATVDEVVAAFAAPELLNFSYLVDPAVKGAVTMTVKAEMSARDAWATFEHILWLSGAYASQNPGFIHIMPFERMPKERRIFADHDVQPNVEVYFATIRNKKSADVLTNLKPFMTDGASATDLSDSNTIVIVDAPANMHKLKELITRLDNKGEREWPVRCFLCREVDAEELAAELQALLPVLGMPVAAATGPSGGAIKITPLPRLRSIVVSAALDDILEEVASWVKTLDRSDMLDREEIFFYNVHHSTVETLSSSLSAFFNTVTTTGPSSVSTTKSTSSRATATTGSSNTNNTASTQSAARSGTSTASRSTRSTGTTGSTASRSTDEQVAALNKSVFETEVTVFTDEESNRLTIKTTPRTWNMIKVFLRRQDVPPRQVAIQAIITEITLNKSNEFGLSYSFSKLINSGEDAFMGGLLGAGSIPTDLSSWTVNDGLGLLLRDSKNDPLALIKAVAGDENTRVLSEPQVIVRSGATAELQVGESISVPSESTSYSSSSDFRTNYEYVETGVIMTVTPYITAGNDVRLEVQQEVSDAKDRGTTSTIPPDIVKKTMSTELVVPDNSTLMMGGMIKNKTNEVRYGIPLLMDIPWLGRIFGSNYKTHTRSELLVLITVNVIDNKNPQEELIRRYKASLEEIEKRDMVMY
jgi:general secretion pathway protein D